MSTPPPATPDSAPDSGQSSPDSPGDESAPSPTTLEALYGVSQQLKQSLEPVAPSTRFRAELREKLAENVSNTRQIIHPSDRRREPRRLSALGIGAVVFGGGLLALAIRLTRILTGRLARKARGMPAVDEDA